MLPLAQISLLLSFKKHFDVAHTLSCSHLTLTQLSSISPSPLQQPPSVSCWMFPLFIPLSLSLCSLFRLSVKSPPLVASPCCCAVWAGCESVHVHSGLVMGLLCQVLRGSEAEHLTAVTFKFHSANRWHEERRNNHQKHFPMSFFIINVQVFLDSGPREA